MNRNIPLPTEIHSNDAVNGVIQCEHKHGVPVLLVLVCLDSRRVFFVCLNDLIEKVIVPADPNFTDKGTKTIYIPVKNEITSDPNTHYHLRFLAKRIKLYSAFVKFVYQANELSYAYDVEYTEERTLNDYRKICEYLLQTKHFIQVIKRYDIWQAGTLWGILHDMYHSVIALEEKIDSTIDVIMSTSEEHLHQIPDLLPDFQYIPALIINDIKNTWDRLVNLSDIYEEICREWALPTYLSDLLS